MFSAMENFLYHEMMATRPELVQGPPCPPFETGRNG